MCRVGLACPSVDFCALPISAVAGGYFFLLPPKTSKDARWMAVLDSLSVQPLVHLPLNYRITFPPNVWHTITADEHA